jgi:prepilin-type N-terminal cleavage/methylation domain-containing protein
MAVMIKCVRQRERGFTLIEIMISLVLICLVVVSVIQLSSANLRNLAQSDNRIRVLQSASDKMRNVLEGEKMEEKAWTESDDQGNVFEITMTEIEKERTRELTVKLLQVTVKASRAQSGGEKIITLKTARMVSISDALSAAKDIKQKGYTN